VKQIRFLIRALVAVAVLAAAVTVAASPATAQKPTVFTFKNVETVEANNDWEVRVSLDSFGGCGEAVGRGDSVSPWLGPQDEWGAVLDLDCSYTITAQARSDRHERGKLCGAAVGWGTAAPADTSRTLRTRDSARGTETTVSVKHAGTAADAGTNCESEVKVTFSLDPDEVVDDLPATAMDSGLTARAERAAEAAQFNIRVAPHEDTKDRTGCNQLHRFTMSGGDDGEHELALPGIRENAACKFVVTVENAPAPFRVVDTDGKTFETGAAGSSGRHSVDLSDLVNMPWGRIAIIQDVTASDNQGHVGYKVARSCAGIDALPPNIVAGSGPGIFTLPGGQVAVSLIEGRYTVHSANFANFGAGANYLAVARSATSTAIDGCEVRVTIQYLPSGCTVSPSHTQTLTWHRSRTFDHYDFEFDIDCGGGVGTPALDIDLPPAPPGTDQDSDQDDTAATSDGADVRIIARRLSNGKIEFGIEQRQSNGSWGGRQLPRARLFPVRPDVGRWLVSSPITVSVAPAGSLAADVQVRVVARLIEDGRVEFGLQERDNGSWGERVLPRRKYFPIVATANRWLGSSALTLDG
jgi:hypothetical protein